VVASATPATWDYHFDFGAHPGLEGAAGFGGSPNSGIDHRIYEFKIPLNLLGASPGDTIGFASPIGPDSIPYDANTGRHNIWPAGAEIDDLSTVQPGEILVCPITSPSWAPVFTKIKAAVTDIGGMTCHAAIVAREYGLPAIVGTGYATKAIKTGDKLKVNADEGVVTIER